MLIFKDIFNGDELASDSFPMKLVDGIIYEFKGAHCVRKEGEITLAGSNPSAEGEDCDDMGGDGSCERGIDFCLNHQLQSYSVYSDLPGFKTYFKNLVKKIVAHMQETKKTPEEITEFKTKITAWFMALIKADKFKTLEMFAGPRLQEGEEGQMAIVEYRDVNGEEVPMLLLIKEALEEEKC